MKYKNIQEAIFIERPNRFIAKVLVDEHEEIVHVKNIGRCKELLLPNSKVIIEKSENPNRKTKYDLIAVYKNNLGWVNIDSQVPNKVVKEWLENKPELFKNVNLIKPEFTYDKSRVDFYLEEENKRIFIEVKGCTLEIDGIGYFPDAPTERGVKHLKELEKAVFEGYECYLAFVIALPNINKVLPNISTHKEFGIELANATKNGVRILYLPCDVKTDELKIIDCIEADYEDIYRC